MVKLTSGLDVILSCDKLDSSEASDKDVEGWAATDTKWLLCWGCGEQQNGGGEAGLFLAFKNWHLICD